MVEDVAVAVVDALFADDPVEVAAAPVEVSAAVLVAESVEPFELAAGAELDAAEVAATDVGAASAEPLAVETEAAVDPSVDPWEPPPTSKFATSRPHAETRPQTAAIRHRIFDGFMAMQAPLGCRPRGCIEPPRSSWPC